MWPLWKLFLWLISLLETLSHHFSKEEMLEGAVFFYIFLSSVCMTDYKPEILAIFNPQIFVVDLLYSVQIFNS